MDENAVVTNEQPVEEQTEPVKAEPTKTDKSDSAEVEKLKRLLSKANSEANSYKQQLREKQTADERAAAERAEQEQAIREELETLRRENDINDSVKRSLALKMDAETSQKLAEAWNAHDKDSMFDCLSNFVDNTVQRLKNEALNRQPGLSAGIPPTKGNTEDEITARLRRYAGLPVHR